MSDAALLACAALLEKLSVAIADENTALTSGENLPVTAFTYRKNQILRDLLAAQRACVTPAALATLAPRYSHIKQLLDRNAMLLQLNLTALHEVSSAIVESIRQAESDGTYSRRQDGLAGW